MRGSLKTSCMILADVPVAEEQGKLNPQAPAYVRKRGQVEAIREAEVPRPQSPPHSDEDVKDATMMA